MPLDRVRRALGFAQRTTAPPRPERPLYAIGDIHGRLDLVAGMLDLIESDRLARGWAERDLVFLGDYVDRGPESAGVLDLVAGLSRSSPGDVTALLGNHEAMFLDFLDAEDSGILWLQNGGLETLASFGLDAYEPLDGFGDLEPLRRQAISAIPPGIVDWLRQRPLYHRSGDVVCVHAALDPDLALPDQDPQVMIWGRGPSYHGARPDGLWVVHGHTITRPAGIFGHRVAIDTGAFMTGILTAAVFAPDEPVRMIDTA